MVRKFKLFDSDSLKLLHRRVFFSITVFIFVYFVSIYRISEIMIFSEKLNYPLKDNINLTRGDIYDSGGNHFQGCNPQAGHPRTQRKPSRSS